MIRPFTCVCLLMAGGSGLFLYTVKHEAQLLDRDVTRLSHLAQENRARAALLRAEYDRLGDPERLRELAAQVLSLQPTEPRQFASLAEFGRRLPAIGLPSPEPTEPSIAEPPAAPAPSPPTLPVPIAAPARPPPPPPRPVPAALPTTIAAATSPAQASVIAQLPTTPRPLVSRAAAAELRPIAPAKPVAAAAVTTPRRAPESIAVANVEPPRSAPMPMTGSALGMARSTSMSGTVSQVSTQGLTTPAASPSFPSNPAWSSLGRR